MCIRDRTEGAYDTLIIHPYLPFSQIGLIISQTPISITMDHHLLMIYENNVDICISISSKARLSLNGEGTSSVSQKLIAKHVIENYLTKETWDFNTKRGRVKRLVYYHLLWSASKHPSNDDLEKMSKAITFVRREMDTSKDTINMLVHDDNGGVSQAAIFVALLSVFEEIDEASLTPGSANTIRVKQEDQTLDIFGVVDNLRSKRMKMISCSDEYKFLYKAAIYYAQNKARFDDLLKTKDEIRLSSNKKDETGRVLDKDGVPEQYVLYEAKETTHCDQEQNHAISYDLLSTNQPKQIHKMGQRTGKALPQEDVPEHYVLYETKREDHFDEYENLLNESMYENV